MIGAEDPRLGAASQSRPKRGGRAADLTGRRLLPLEPQIGFTVQLKLQMVRQCGDPRIVPQTASSAIAYPMGEPTRLDYDREPLAGVLAGLAFLRGEHFACFLLSTAGQNLHESSFGAGTVQTALVTHRSGSMWVKSARRDAEEGMPRPLVPMLLLCSPTSGVSMAFDPVTDGRYRDPATSDNWMADHRARVALEESGRLERKQQELLQQTCERSTPAERIRVWERRHGLTLPRDTNHRLLNIVARQTDLALAQVREEQQRRLGRIDADVAVVMADESTGST